MLFPKNFFWGASTSAFQIEGAYNIDGKGLATTDVRHVPEGMADTKVACDHYHHWKEDVDLMAELGLKTYRMGFSWSRIMPVYNNSQSERLDIRHSLAAVPEVCKDEDISIAFFEEAALKH